MDNDAPAAPAEAPKAPESEANPTPTTNPEPAPAPDMHGFTSEQLADMRKFYDSQGGYEKVKSRISNPEKYAPKPTEAPQTASEPKNDNEPTSQPNPPAETPYKAPEGSITAQEFLAQQYFQGLSRDPKYEGISEQIQSGDILKEMASFNIQALNQDGSINDMMVRRFLDLKAQTVPAKPTGTEPDASAAPTVTYTEVGENGITSLDEAYKILMEPGNSNMAKAEEFIKNHFNPNSGKK